MEMARFRVRYKKKNLIDKCLEEEKELTYDIPTVILRTVRC